MLSITFLYGTKAENLEEVLKSGVYIGHKYIFQMYQTIHFEFISANKGKRRFRNVPDFLWNYLSPRSYDHDGLINSLEYEAKRGSKPKVVVFSN